MKAKVFDIPRQKSSYIWEVNYNGFAIALKRSEFGGVTLIRSDTWFWLVICVSKHKQEQTATNQKLLSITFDTVVSIKFQFSFSSLGLWYKVHENKSIWIGAALSTSPCIDSIFAFLQLQRFWCSISHTFSHHVFF